MGLADELGYHHRPANAVQRWMQHFASSRLGAWVFSRTLPTLDRLVLRITRGRWTNPEVLAGLPVLVLATTGARTGLSRATPLLGIPDEDGLAVIGTNWGQPRSPAWVRNLLADPRGVVSYRNRSVAVDARLASPDDARRILENASGIYLGYGRYLDRISGREVRVFVLTAASTPG